MRTLTIKESIENRLWLSGENGLTVGAEEKKDGYIVGGVDELKADSWKDLSDKEVAKIFTTYQMSKKLFKELTFGVWIDPETDEVYIDIGCWVQDYESAVTRGQLLAQKAIWDVKNETEIYLSEEEEEDKEHVTV